MWLARLKKAAVALAFFGAVVAIIWMLLPDPVPVPGINVAEKLPPAIKDAPTETVKDAAPPVVLKKTPKARKVTRLPAAVFDDASTEIQATSTFKAREDTSYTATSTLNKTTGTTDLHVAENPRPWLEFPNRGAIGLGTSLVTGDARLHGRYDAVRSKSFVLTLEGRLEEGGRKDAEIYLDYRF